MRATAAQGLAGHQLASGKQLHCVSLVHIYNYYITYIYIVYIIIVIVICLFLLCPSK